VRVGGIAAGIVIAIVIGWLIRRWQRQNKDLSPRWLNETAYDKRGDRRFK
jgi:NhaP-type Na+/H+ or K+/H+ antiporter